MEVNYDGVSHPKSWSGNVSPSVEKVLENALGLPEKERLELIDALIAATPEVAKPPFDES
jgi:hypothetical protein